MISHFFKRKKISVVIPVLNESQTIGTSLSRLHEEIEHHEVVVVDGGSTDGTMDIVGAFPNVKRVFSSVGRATQMNCGAVAAQGDILLFIHADTHLPPGGLSLVESRIGVSGIVAGSFSLSFDYPNPFLRLYALFSRINHILFTYGDQGLFVAKDVFEGIGGFRRLPIMEDVEIQKRLRKRGRFVKLRQPVITSARRFLTHGIIRQEILNICLVLLYFLGVSPSRLAKIYEYPAHKPPQK
jgi:rSAM/selenodomain-associated transferase 2